MGTVTRAEIGSLHPRAVRAVGVGRAALTAQLRGTRVVTRAAPRHVFLGWKNFYTKDHPMLSPRQTMAKTPKPVMISYQ